jgi:hypothetical protein
MCRRPDIAVMLTIGLTLAAAGMKAKAAVIDGAPSPSAPSSATRSIGSAAQQQTPRYHLRCWQNGRLLFEQAVASLPADAGHSSTRLQSKDGAQEPVIVYETRNATCMARSLRTTR